MTTIDAAIIKALVAHIGGDPNTVPDGTIGGGGVSSSYLNATWDVDDKSELTFTLPEGQVFDIGSIIRLKATTGQSLEVICVSKYTTDGDERVYYNLRQVSDLSDFGNLVLEPEGYYGTRFKTTSLVMPDNVTSGILDKPSYDVLVKMLMAVIDKAIPVE